MHELPQNLTNSLRSYRGSIYSSKAQQGHADGADVEKGPEDYGDKDLGRWTESSLILHPTKSTGGLAQLSQEKNNMEDPTEKQKQITQVGGDNHMQQLPNIDTQIAPAKLANATPAKKSPFDMPLVKDADPAADRLAEDMHPLSNEDFFKLMGLRQPSAAGETPKHLATPNGLFATITHDQRRVELHYHMFDILAYVLLGLQLILGAVFIVLGSLAHVDSHIAIAVLGAISTVVAGCLALMKGNGLPNRLRQTRDSLRTVIFAAEELFWDVQSGRTVLYKDVKQLREDYLRVLEEARQNHPDTWNSATSAIRQGATKGGAKEGGEKV